MFTIQLRRLDVEEMLGLTDGTLLVGCLEALRVGLAFEKAAHLPIPAGIGKEDSQFAGVIGYGGNRGHYRCRAVAASVKFAVVCC